MKIMIRKGGLVAIEGIAICILPFIWMIYSSTNSYTSPDEVHDMFPIAVMENGTPNIIRWYKFRETPDVYMQNLLTNPTNESSKLDRYDIFTLEMVSDDKYVLVNYTENYTFYAEYSVADETVIPTYLRITGFNVFFGGVMMLVPTLIVVRILHWLFSLYSRKRQGSPAE